MVPTFGYHTNQLQVLHIAAGMISKEQEQKTSIHLNPKLVAQLLGP